MFVELWTVGARAPSLEAMSTNDISAHLAADWVPSLPSAVGSAFIGWPPFLIDTVALDGAPALALREEAGRSERQWKSVLSWMLAVAGTRHFLTLAPLCACIGNRCCHEHRCTARAGHPHCLFPIWAGGQGTAATGGEIEAVKLFGKLRHIMHGTGSRAVPYREKRPPNDASWTEQNSYYRHAMYLEHPI